MYDYTIIGAGVFGATFARVATDSGFKCKVIDKRPHIAGNCYTEKAKDGYDIHLYGPHIFHTNSENIWDFVNRYSEFNGYVHQQTAISGNRRYQFPINRNTLEQVFGVEDTLQKFKLDLESVEKQTGNSIEDWCLNNIGPTLYELFIKNYVSKHWGRDPKNLPDLIIRRLKLKFDRNDKYYANRYEGIPVNGYTELFSNLLHGIDVELGTPVDHNLIQNLEKNTNRKIVYTGTLDEFFNFSKGKLSWRSLEFRTEIAKTSTPVQPHAIETYNDLSTELTRSSEFWHFNPSKNLTESVISKETAVDWDSDKIPMYPINNDHNNELVRQYIKLIDKNKYVFGGRLATYKYYDMDQVMAAAITAFNNELL